MKVGWGVPLPRGSAAVVRQPTTAEALAAPGYPSAPYRVPMHRNMRRRCWCLGVGWGIQMSFLLKETGILEGGTLAVAARGG